MIFLLSRFQIIDFIVSPILLIVILAICFAYVKFLPDKLGKYYIQGISVRLIGGISFSLVYALYYGKGDTFGYYNAASILNSSLSESIQTWFSMMLSDNHSLESQEYISRMGRYRQGSEYFLIRITAFCNLFTFNSYLGTTLLFSSFSFLGSWCFYRTLIKYYPHLKRTLVFSVFFLPSLVFWGSGILKDSIVLGCIGFLVFGIHLINRKSVYGLFIVSFAAWFIFNLRGFMLPILIIPLAIIAYSKALKSIRNRIVKLSGSILGLCAFTVLISIFSDRILEELAEFAQEAAVSSNYLYRVSILKGGSAYSLGKIDGSIPNMLAKIPSGIWVSLFRPYLWEVQNPVMLLSALETAVVTFFTIYIIFKIGFLRILHIIKSDLFLQYALIFSILFAFVVGITSYNFGSLVRYRIPILFFFFPALTIINGTRRVEK